MVPPKFSEASPMVRLIAVIWFVMAFKSRVRVLTVAWVADAIPRMVLGMAPRVEVSVFCAARSASASGSVGLSALGIRLFTASLAVVACCCKVLI